jgi:hypothetical protein
VFSIRIVAKSIAGTGKIEKSVFVSTSLIVKKQLFDASKVGTARVNTPASGHLAHASLLAKVEGLTAHQLSIDIRNI